MHHTISYQLSRIALSAAAAAAALMLGGCYKGIEPDPVREQSHESVQQFSSALVSLDMDYLDEHACSSVNRDTLQSGLEDLGEDGRAILRTALNGATLVSDRSDQSKQTFAISHDGVDFWLVVHADDDYCVEIVR